MRPFLEQSVFDKHAHVKGCVRLPIALDGNQLGAEVAALPASVWGSTAGRKGVHRAAEALFLRGHAPAEGEMPIEDRPILKDVPYLRTFIEETMPAPPLRALLAKLPAGARIPPHVDRGAYFNNSIRIHVPIETNDEVWMYCDGRGYHMGVGEVWALNNISTHAVWNAHPSQSRTHLICDFLPSEQLLDLIAQGEKGLGRPIDESDQAALAAPPAANG